ncbi:hypothetical protein RHS01_10042 [Rhizoctonia solani]|uniref:Uncharacterized protein n=1 Tax=Rhizoctonia solani TaxID=456999 RepID=A0A8H7M0A8_9AGAM|nr:hypothetical protein RHS01_10042 [Rhizoctonia solani]
MGYDIPTSAALIYRVEDIIAGLDCCNEAYEHEHPGFNDTIGHDAHEQLVPGPHPPSSPPCSPLPKQDNPELSEDKEGYLNVDAIDLQEYKQWHAEDHLGKEVDMFAATLEDEEIDSIVMLAIQQFGTVTQSNYERI